MSISPRTQALMDGPNGSAQDIFEAGFQELAFNQLLTKLPDLAEQISTFKILDADPASNSATGTFIILRPDDDEVHIPVVLADNALAPFDVMYIKSIDSFLPVSDAWLSEVDRMGTSQMGEASKTPENLRSDVDIRNVVVPPTTGRYSYASASYGRFLPSYLKEASDGAKKTFLETMKKYPKLAQYTVRNYDPEELIDALRPHRKKVASARVPEVKIVTIETPVRETKALFREDAPRAMHDIVATGYAVHDVRPYANTLVPAREEIQSLQTPSDVGFYRVYFTDGSSPACVVFPKVTSARSLIYKDSGKEDPDAYFSHDSYGDQLRIVLTAQNNVVVTTRDFPAEVLQASNVPDTLMDLLEREQPGTPRNGQRGFFFDPSSKNLTALEPFKIDFVTTKEGVRSIKATTYSGERIQINQIEDSPIRTMKAFLGPREVNSRDTVPSGAFLTSEERSLRRNRGHMSSDDDLDGSVILVPWHYKFIAINDVKEPSCIMRSPQAVIELLQTTIKSAGARTLKLTGTSDGQVQIGSHLYSRIPAIEKLATEYNVRVPDADFAVKTACQDPYTSKTFFVYGPKEHQRYVSQVKLAYDGVPMGQEPEPGQGMYPEDNYEDPSMMDPSMMDPSMMDPSMMGPSMMGPPPIDAVGMAADEIMMQLQQSQAEIQNQLMMHHQSLQTQLGAIEAVRMRAQQIEMEHMGMYAGEPVGAPDVSMPPPPVSGDPAQEMGVPTPHGMGPPQGGMGMDPYGEGEDMGDDMPMGESGLSPDEGYPYYGGMPVEEPLAMEQAMDLEDPELFDAAAIASIANQNAFDHSVAAFMPIFRDALDATGRMLMELRMKAGELRERFGDAKYSEIVDYAEGLLANMGEMVVSLNDVLVGAIDE